MGASVLAWNISFFITQALHAHTHARTPGQCFQDASPYLFSAAGARLRAGGARRRSCAGPHTRRAPRELTINSNATVSRGSRQRGGAGGRRQLVRGSAMSVWHKTMSFSSEACRASSAWGDNTCHHPAQRCVPPRPRLRGACLFLTWSAVAGRPRATRVCAAQPSKTAAAPRRAWPALGGCAAAPSPSPRHDKKPRGGRRRRAGHARSSPRRPGGGEATRGREERGGRSRIFSPRRAFLLAGGRARTGT